MFEVTLDTNWDELSWEHSKQHGSSLYRWYGHRSSNIQWYWCKLCSLMHSGIYLLLLYRIRCLIICRSPLQYKFKVLKWRMPEYKLGWSHQIKVGCFIALHGLKYMLYSLIQWLFWLSGTQTADSKLFQRDIGVQCSDVNDVPTCSTPDYNIGHNDAYLPRCSTPDSISNISSEDEEVENTSIYESPIPHDDCCTNSL